MDNTKGFSMDSACPSSPRRRLGSSLSATPGLSSLCSSAGAQNLCKSPQPVLVDPPKPVPTPKKEQTTKSFVCMKLLGSGGYADVFLAREASEKTFFDRLLTSMIE
jgi:hypothetical protein